MELLDWLLAGTIPVGGGVLRVPEILGNEILRTQPEPLWGQAGRQVFFAAAATHERDRIAV